MEGRTSDAHASCPIRVLDPWQVWDGPGCFYTHLRATTERHPEGVVYKDGFGQRIVIREAR